MLVWHYIDSIEIRIGGNSMIEEEKIEEEISSDGSGPISPPKAKTTRKRTTKKVEKPVIEDGKAEVPEVIEEPKIKTHKTYVIEIHVNDPLPQANDISVDVVVGQIIYDEATDTVSSSATNSKYDTMFNRFVRMGYFMETEDAPVLMTPAAGKNWAMNLHKAVPKSLIVNEPRGIYFTANAPQISNEEPI